MYQYIWKKITSVVTSERTPSDASYQKYVALVALLFFIYLVNFIMLHCFPMTILSSSNPSITADVPTRPPKSRFMCCDHRFALQLYFHFFSSTFVWALPAPFLKHFHFTFPIPLGPTSPDLSDSVLLDVHVSINFFHFPDNLLLEDGQDSIFFSYLFKHHPAVKFIADLLEIVPGKKGTEVEVQSYNLWFCAQQSAFRISE